MVEKIEDVLKEKDLDLTRMYFDGMNNTNAMSGAKSGLQRSFRHRVPQAKYVNRANQNLTLVFVHLLKMRDFNASMMLTVYFCLYRRCFNIAM